MSSRSSKKSRRYKPTKIPEKLNEARDERNKILFDLTEETIGMLGVQIVVSVRKSVDLLVVSSASMKHPEKSLTVIPGLSFLFLEACLQQGLLGYLDWKNEKYPSRQNTIIMNNVIIATCGSISTVPEGGMDACSDLVDDGVPSELIIAHEIDESKLSYIREKSRAKFEELLQMY